MHLRSRLGFALLASLLLLGSCAALDSPGWRSKLDRRLTRYGHRNWIAVVDSAYPAQARESIETVVTGASQLEVVRAVLDAVSKSRHVRAQIFLDRELEFVDDHDAPGIAAYRSQLAELLKGRTIERSPHKNIIESLDSAGTGYELLVLKTDLALPYTSVFLRLNCGYWSDEQENHLREAMEVKR